jgi:parallel beta-helix repeat protein
MGCYEYQGGTPSAAGIVYVKQGGSGTKVGSSWQNAIAELADALYTAKTNTAIQQIWVAKGTYSPMYAADGISSNSSDRAFVLVDGVQVYGGFPATGNPGMNNRNADVYPVNLIGNGYHVIIASGNINQNNGTALLDGFSITGGTAYGSGYITVNGNQIYRNKGGGIYIHSSNSNLKNSEIRANSASNGGGVYTVYPSGSSLPASVFAVLESVLIIDNQSDNGGGVYNENFSGEWKDISIIHNEANTKGGGMYNLRSSPVFTNLRVCGNMSNSGSSAIYNDQSSPKIYNGLIVQNRVMNPGSSGWSQGGAIVNQSSSPELRNVTMSRNLPNGMGIENLSNSFPLLCNTIIWSGLSAGAAGSQGVIDMGGSSSVYNNCLIENIAQTANNLPPGTSPNFVNPMGDENYHSNYGDYHLSPGSPCIDYGDMSCMGIYAFDLDRTTPRAINNIDLGCYEFNPANPNPPNSPYHKHNGNEIIADQPQETLAASDIKLNVYPNPSSSGEQVQVRLGNEGVYYENAVTANLYSLEGKLLKTKDCSNGAFSLEMPPLAAGIYLLTIRTTEGKTYNKKIVIK